MRASRSVYEFGHFHLDAGEQVLFCAGTPVPLTQKAFAVLRVLVKNGGHLVTKDELMRQVWPEACVEEGNLSQAISALRKAFGESHQSHQSHEYIETVARRGYRFIATVKMHDEPDGLSIEGIEVTDRTPERNSESGKVGERSTHGVSASEWVAKRYGENEQAHHLYLRGRYYWSKYTLDGLKEGIQQFSQAIKIDPDYALPYTGLADCYYRLSNIHLPPRKAMRKAKTAVMKALKRDETLAEAHALLGLIRMFYDRDWPTAKTEFKRAIKLGPRSALAHKRYGWILGMLGQFDESIKEMNHALDLEPRSPDLHAGLGIILHLARRYDAAIAQAQLALDIEPEFFPAHVLLGIAHVQQNRLTEGVAELEKAASLADVPWTLGYLGYAYGVSGQRRQALMVLAELENRSAGACISSYAMALVHTGLGHKEQALQSLVKTFEDRNEMSGFVKTSPEFDGLRQDQRFAAMMTRSRLSVMAA